MANRELRPGGFLLATLFVCVLGQTQRLLAQQTEQVRGSDLSQAEAQPVSEPEVTPGQSFPVPPPASPQTQPASPQTQTPSANDPATVQPQPPTKSQRPENDRIFFALPNYLTVEKAAKLPPLTTREKFKTVAEGVFDPVEVVFIGIQAGIDQADNANPTYHQGFVGYSRRLGTDYADAVIGNFGTGAIFPSLLHQDPRYYQMGKGNFFHRFEYAAVRVLITRSDSSGKTQFNFSEFLGNGLAAGLSNTYHPRPHTIASTTDVLSTQTLLDVAGYELKEFWPDIHRLLMHVHHQP
jgi:hypothetical protein